MEDEGAERALRSARTAAAILVAAPVVLVAVAAAVPLEPSAPSLATPAVLAGLLAPALGFHLYRRMQEAGTGRFVRATIVSLACTEAGATLGVVAFLLSREPLALVGVAMHVLLAGAIWPSRERLESFLSTGQGGG